MKGLVRIDPKERTDLLDVQANLAKIIEQMPNNFVPLTIEGSIQKLLISPLKGIGF